MNETFGQMIKRLRLIAGYKTLGDLHRASKIPASTLSRIENDIQKPMPNTLHKLAPFLHISYEELMGAAGYLPETNETLPPGAIPVGETKKIPVIGTIRCGEPIYAYEDVQEWVDVPVKDLNGAEHFFLRVTGDSMTGSRIYPGDLVLVRRQDVVENGQIAVVMVRGEEATLKRVKYMEEAIILYPDNPKYQPQIYKASEVKIIGRVVKVEFRP